MPIQLDLLPMMLFTALLCLSDVVAAVSIVNYEAQPKLFSCIFGEGVFNDIVSIILFNTVNNLQTQTFETSTIFVIIGQFLLLGVVSILVGLIYGVITSLVFKHFRFMTVTPIVETFLIFSICLTAYFTSELLIIGGI